MVISCCAYNCVARAKKKENSVSFHSFPKDAEIKRQWIIALRRDHFIPTKYSKVCSNHFTADCFNNNSWSSKKLLKKDAIPTVFDFPTHLLKTVKPRKPPAERRFESSTNETTEQTLRTTSECETAQADINRPKRRKVFIGDFKEDFASTSSQETSQKNYAKLVTKVLKKKNKQIKILQQTKRRLLKRVQDLETFIQHLKANHMLDEEASLTLLDSMSSSSKQIFKQILTTKRKQNYPPELKSFALTLNFYSPRAYTYVRKTFNNALPHPRTLQKWYQSVDCKPGFHTEALSILTTKVCELQAKGKRTVCALMIDEMSIHRKIEWDGEKFIGFVDFGAETVGENYEDKPEAKEAIVFMLNAVNDRWKLPVAYFLINGLAGREKANLICKCLRLIHGTGVEVISLTFDGAAANFTMAKSLGAELCLNSLKTFFSHPVTKQPVYILLDPPHMLKLLRNTLGTYKLMYDDNGQAIKWEYFEKLVNVQTTEGLHLATKITKRHVEWQREKMKVKLAAQTFSLSVAKAIRYLRETKYSSDFVGSEATERFIILINDMFDILNSRNLLAKGFKSGLTQSNKAIILSKINEFIRYISLLRCSKNGEFLHLSGRRVGFIGFIVSAKSYLSLAEQYVFNENGPLKYLLSYKLCQDHLEVFFSAIRSRGGYNNNPTVKLFEASYKRLLMHTEVSGSMKANCIEQAPSIILCNLKNKAIKTIDNFLTEPTDDDQDNDNEYLAQEFSTEAFLSLSLYVSDVVEYIAGFVVRKLKKIIQCENCITALESDEPPSNFIGIKNYVQGKKCLITPSLDVIHVCKVAETQIRIHDQTILYKKNVIQFLVTKILGNVRNNIFKGLNNHILDEEMESNHIIHLIKVIALNYLNVRLYYKAECMNIKNEKRIRSKLTKTILFTNQ